MRSSSEKALQGVQEAWEHELAGGLDSAITAGQELFAVVDLLLSEHVIVRALADSDRVAEDRIALARQLLNTRVSEPVIGIVARVVGQSWARDADITNALEELGVQAILAHTQDRLGLVEEELYRTIRVLSQQRDLRIILGDRTYPADRREKLARQVFTHLMPESLELVVRAVQRAPEPTIVQSLTRDMDVAAERGRHLVASVTSAMDLTPDQLQRLTKILSERYGQAVAVHVTVNPKVVGGLRIHVGEDVIDGTLETRIEKVRDAITR